LRRFYAAGAAKSSHMTNSDKLCTGIAI